MQRGVVVVSGEPLGRGARGGGGGGVARGRLLPPGVSPCIAVLLLRRSGLFAFVFLNRVLLPGRPAGTIENWKGRRKNRVRMQPAARYPKPLQTGGERKGRHAGQTSHLTGSQDPTSRQNDHKGEE